MHVEFKINKSLLNADSYYTDFSLGKFFTHRESELILMRLRNRIVFRRNDKYVRFVFVHFKQLCIGFLKGCKRFFLPLISYKRNKNKLTHA